MTNDFDPIARYRDRILTGVYRRLVTGAHYLRRRYHASFRDFDLTIEDLSHHGAVSSVLCFDWMMKTDPERYLSLPQEDLQRCVLHHATQAMAWHIIDTYRRRDLRRDKVAPEDMLAYVDASNVERVALWRRVEGLMSSMTPRQWAIVGRLWNGLDSETIGAELRVTPNVIQKELSAVRRLAA